MVNISTSNLIIGIVVIALIIFVIGYLGGASPSGSGGDSPITDTEYLGLGAGAVTLGILSTLFI